MAEWPTPILGPDDRDCARAELRFAGVDVHEIPLFVTNNYLWGSCKAFATRYNQEQFTSVPDCCPKRSDGRLSSSPSEPPVLDRGFRILGRRLARG